MLIIILIFILGLCMGSFVNCLVYRLQQKKSFIKGRSQCPDCGHVLGFLDLIPIFSFVFLKGKCRYCGKKISWQYPLVELAVGLAFLAVFLMARSPLSHLEIIRNLLIISVLSIIFLYDLKYQLVLDKVVLPATIVIFIFNIFLGYSITKMLLAGLVLLMFFLLQYILSKGKWIGLGDARLGLLMGIALSWPLALVALFISYFIGAIVSVYLLLLGKKNMKSEIPLGPFLAIGTVIVLLYGQIMLERYLNLLI